MMYIAFGLLIFILFLYVVTWNTRDSFARRMAATLPALKKNMEIILSTELEKIRASGKITGDAAEFAKQLLKDIVEGRKHPSLLVSAIQEKYPEALNGDLYKELLAVTNSSLSAIANAQKEQIDEALDFEGDMSTVFGMITVKIWSTIGLLDMTGYRQMKEVYQKTILTVTAKKVMDEGVMPEVQV